MNWMRSLAALIVMSGLAGPAMAQAYPDRPIRMIVPFPPGGGGDSVARIVGIELGKRLGQTIVVENKPGADQVIGTTALARAPADGYTVMLTGNAMMVHAAYARELPYDAFKDVVPVAKIANVPVVLLANPQVGVKTLGELIDLARKKPGQLKAAHIGTGSVQYFNVKLLEHLEGVKFLDVPYKGTGPAMTALMSGEVDIAFAGVGGGAQLAESGKAVALGVSNTHRSTGAPGIPTLEEAGTPGFVLTSDFYLYAPGGLPVSIAQRLNREIKAILEEPATARKLTDMGFEVEIRTQAQSIAEHKEYYELHRKLIKTLGLTWNG